MRLLLDEMLPAAIAHELRSEGHDADAVTEHPDLRGLGDPDIFEVAQQQARATVTYNRDDFLALDRRYRHEGRDHHGIVILNPNRFPQGAQSFGRLVEALGALVIIGPAYSSFVHWLR